MSTSVSRRTAVIAVLTLVFALCVQVPSSALAENSGSSAAGSQAVVSQSDVSSSAVARSDDSSSAVQATEAPAPVAAQSVEEDGWHSDAGGTYYVEGGARVVSDWRVVATTPSGASGAIQRHWVDSTAHACVPGYSTDGWAHWTTTYGYVLRGSMRYDSDGVLLADNDAGSPSATRREAGSSRAPSPARSSATASTTAAAGSSALMRAPSASTAISTTAIHRPDTSTATTMSR